MPQERIVAVAFLTAHDLETLGSGFSRAFPIDEEDIFADLLAQLDHIEIESTEKGVLIRQEQR